MTLQIHVLDALHINDNYVFLLHDDVERVTAVVDPCDAEVVLTALEERGWSLDYTLVTHHHWDHVGGNKALKRKTRCQVVGFAEDAARIPGIDIGLKEGEAFNVGEHQAHIIAVPGHVDGHIAYYFEDASALFCGDSLFALGCGRIFEGTPAQMHESLQKLAGLPDDTRVYCAHEYTLANSRFARAMEPNNEALEEYIRTAKAKRKNGEATIPTLMKDEKACNPFLRPHSDVIRQTLGTLNASDVEVFTEIRRRKDRF